jgi:regulator of replication initiation timing
MAILENVKEVARLAQEIGKIDLYQKTVELMAQVTDLATENFELKQQVNDLKKRLEVKGKVAYNPKNHTYTLDGHGAYCATCYDQFGALQRLHAASVAAGSNEPDVLGVQFRCQRCKWESRNWARIRKDVFDWPTT